MVYIYTLKDPDNNNVRYVGKTSNLLRRYNAHINRTKISKTHVSNWIGSLLKENKKPVMDVLETTDDNSWVECEKKWIKYYRELKNDLTNITYGGECPPPYGRLGKKNTPEHIRKTREGRLGKPIKRNLISNQKRKEGLIKFYNKNKKPVKQYDLNENFIKTWPSAVDAATELWGYTIHSNITACCKNKHKTCKGFMWRY